jgi:hypothetical protein
MDCNLTSPLQIFLSTDLNSKINSFSRLGDRISRSLGAPLVNVEIHQDQLFENISIACEFFTKYAGYTEECIIFNSALYQKDVGIRLDQLFSVTPYFNKTVQPISAVYIAMSAIPASEFSSSQTFSAIYPNGIFQNQLLSQWDYLSAISFDSSLTACFSSSNSTINEQRVNSFDYDIMDYRKVIAVTDFEEGSSTGVNTLFTIEQTLAQQTYFSYAAGNYGFDLISWYILKDWLKNREKLLAQRRYFTFDPRTQYLVMYPQPSTTQFWGVLPCYVERPLKDIIKEQWVYQYSLALSKIVCGRVRGKYQNTTLFGGGTLNIDLLSEGLAEKEKLEQKLLTGASSAFGDADPPIFMVG